MIYLKGTWRALFFDVRQRFLMLVIDKNYYRYFWGSTMKERLLGQYAWISSQEKKVGWF